MNKYLSIITLSVNGLIALIKRHRVAEWMIKHNSLMCCLQGTHLRTKDLHSLKVKGWKKICKGRWKKSGVAILISNKVDFKRKAIM